MEEPNNKKSTTFFVLVAIANLALLFFLSSFLDMYFEKRMRGDDLLTNPFERYELEMENESKNKVDSVKDPFITRNPDLEDRLLKPIINANNPSLGNQNAEIKIVQFSDFTCSFCQEQERKIKKIMSKYEGKVRLIWKDYPALNVNSESFQAALAGRCAFKQDKFWDFHDRAFFYKDEFNQKNLKSIAKDLDLDIREFNNCFDSPQTIKEVKEAIDEADKLKISGVPFIFINDQEILGEVDVEVLEKIIEIELGEEVY